jgi:hypothetical protein
VNNRYIIGRYIRARLARFLLYAWGLGEMAENRFGEGRTAVKHGALDNFSKPVRILQ